MGLKWSDIDFVNKTIHIQRSLAYIPKKGYIFAHTSGYLRVETTRCTNLLEPDKKYEILISVKAQGPAYVSGSKKTNAVFIDRVLLLEPETGKKK